MIQGAELSDDVSHYIGGDSVTHKQGMSFATGNSPGVLASISWKVPSNACKYLLACLLCTNMCKNRKRMLPLLTHVSWHVPQMFAVDATCKTGSGCRWGCSWLLQ